MLERACAWVALSQNLSQNSTCVLDDKGTAGNVLVCSHTPASVSSVKDRHLGQLQEIERPARGSRQVSLKGKLSNGLFFDAIMEPSGRQGAIFNPRSHVMTLCGSRLITGASGNISVQAAWLYALSLAQVHAVWQDCVAIRASALFLQSQHRTCWHTVLQLDRCEGHSG